MSCGKVYAHRYLDQEEEKKFKELYDVLFVGDPIMSLIHCDARFLAIFPMIIVALIVCTVMAKASLAAEAVAMMLGLLSVQLNFITSHMWAHALMLEYDLWETDMMLAMVGRIGVVVPHAFHHHHFLPGKDWWDSLPSKRLIGDGRHAIKDGNFSIAVAHWVSFSLFTLSFPTRMVWIVAVMLWLFPVSAVYFLFYELGVILLPIAHDWVHNRNAALGILYHILLGFERIGIIAARADHKSHHIHNHRTVYQAFSSSGIYSRILDKVFDRIWDAAFDYSVLRGIDLHKVLWYGFVATLYGQICVIPAILGMLV
jgi:hypothetical protein